MLKFKEKRTKRFSFLCYNKQQDEIKKTEVNDSDQ